MGSCCIKPNFYSKHRIFQIAYSVFLKIALPSKRIINKQAVQEYFQQYSQSCYEILMRQIDFNNDGIITQNQWMAYWELIRKSGQELGKIQKELKRIQKGDITLSFPKAKHYQPNQPRISLVTDILGELKNDATIIPFLTDVTNSNN